MPATNNPTASKRPRSDKVYDPREEAKAIKKPKTPATMAKNSSTATQPQKQVPQASGSTTLRSDQELEAEARQTQLDIGFVLTLSEDPKHALELASNDLEKEAAIQAMKVAEIVSTTSVREPLKVNFTRETNYPLQNNRAKNKPADVNNNPTNTAFPNMTAGMNTQPQPRRNVAQITEQFQ